MADNISVSVSLAKIRQLLTSLYGEARGAATFQQISLLIDHYQKRMPEPHQDQLRHSDAVLITYGDQVTRPGEAPLDTLSRFCEKRIAHTVTSVHILPFYPYTQTTAFRWWITRW